jgi:hypothetical protein
MRKCIYCLQEKQESEFGEEHVIPKSFGTFGDDTPKLKCVCKNCNNFFGRELDLLLARETLEGVMRYKSGLQSRETRPQTKIIVTLKAIPEIPDLEGVRVCIDGKTGTVLPPPPQVLIKKVEDQKYESVLRPDFQQFDWKNRGYLDKERKLKLRIIAPSRKEHDDIIEELKVIGIIFKKESEINFEPLMNHDELLLNISGVIDHFVKRALVKILFNFSAYYIGQKEVIKTQWDKARQYVRYNSSPLRARISKKPFWGEETEQIRFSNKNYNLRVSNYYDKKVAGVRGEIQLFNLYLYDFILVENYLIAEDDEVGRMFIPGQKPFKFAKIKSNIAIVHTDHLGRWIVK